MARLTGLVDAYAWALDEARAALPGADVRLSTMDYGYSVVLGVRDEWRLAALTLEGVDRQERDGRSGTFRLSEFDIRCWITWLALNRPTA